VDNAVQSNGDLAAENGQLKAEVRQLKDEVERLTRTIGLLRVAQSISDLAMDLLNAPAAPAGALS
jgi:hypothetical protein